MLGEGEGVDVGKLGWLEGGHHLGRLVGVLGPVPQHLHPGRPSEPLLEVEVDGVIGARLPHPVGAPVEGHGVAGRVLGADGGQVADVEPDGHLGVRHRQVDTILLGTWPQRHK